LLPDLVNTWRQPGGRHLAHLQQHTVVAHLSHQQQQQLQA